MSTSHYIVWPQVPVAVCTWYISVLLSLHRLSVCTINGHIGIWNPAQKFSGHAFTCTSWLNVTLQELVLELSLPIWSRACSGGFHAFFLELFTVTSKRRRTQRFCELPPPSWCINWPAKEDKRTTALISHSFWRYYRPVAFLVFFIKRIVHSKMVIMSWWSHLHNVPNLFR